MRVGAPWSIAVWRTDGPASSVPVRRGERGLACTAIRIVHGGAGGIRAIACGDQHVGAMVVTPRERDVLAQRDHIVLVTWCGRWELERDAVHRNGTGGRGLLRPIRLARGHEGAVPDAYEVNSLAFPPPSSALQPCSPCLHVP